MFSFPLVSQYRILFVQAALQVEWIAARPINAFVIDLNILPQLPAPEPFEHDAMHLARFPAN
jgi:hypothetical protein